MRQAAITIWNELMPRSPVFTTAEVAESGSMALASASRGLAKLEEERMVTRVRRGLWAITTHPDFSPYAVVPHLFRDGEEGYVSLLSALNLHGMIEQIPPVVQVVTTTQRARLKTPVATYEFHQIQSGLFEGFGPYRQTGNFDIATPEKALFDTMYLAARKGRRFAHLPEVELPESFSSSDVEAWIALVDHDPLRHAITTRWKSLVQSARRSGAT